MAYRQISRIGIHIFPSALKFVKLLGSSAAESLAKFHSTMSTLTPSFFGACLHKTPRKIDIHRLSFFFSSLITSIYTMPHWGDTVLFIMAIMNSWIWCQLFLRTSTRMSHHRLGGKSGLVAKWAVNNGLPNRLLHPRSWRAVVRLNIKMPSSLQTHNVINT